MINVGWRRQMAEVIAELPRNRFGERVWLVRCDCGNEQQVAQTKVKHKVSCGCRRSPRSHGFAAKDKSARPPEYGVWCDIKKRCSNPKHRRFKDYGGRGISVHPRWATSFLAFLEDMGRRPSSLHEIDRVDNDRGYEPGNCRWVTASENCSNKRNNVLLTHDGRTQTMAQWSREVGITEKQLRARIKLGWSHSDALTKPLKRDRRRAA